jgi:hypothetical protein
VDADQVHRLVFILLGATGHFHASQKKMWLSEASLALDMVVFGQILSGLRARVAVIWNERNHEA